MTHGGDVWQGAAPSDWLDYSANLRPEGMPDWVKAALEEGAKNARYYPDPQMRRATKAMAAYLGIPEECVRPSAGGISAIQMANRLPSSRTLICTPCFCEYEQFATSPVQKISLLKGVHGIADPSEALEGCLAEGCAVWLCNPLNPVGVAFSREQVERLLSRLEQANGWLIVDEAFIEYCPEHSAVSLVERHERLLVTGSLTKILGIPGVRLGYLCAQPQLLKALQTRQLTWELSSFAEAVACALPEHKENILADSRTNAQRRESLRDALEGLGAFVYPSEAAFLLADFGKNADALVRHLNGNHILVRSCMSFDGLDDGRHLRLAVKDEASNERLIEQLREAMTCAENR